MTEASGSQDQPLTASDEDGELEVENFEQLWASKEPKVKPDYFEQL
jgi:hypothetical protein